MVYSSQKPSPIYYLCYFRSNFNCSITLFVSSLPFFPPSYQLRLQLNLRLLLPQQVINRDKTWNKIDWIHVHLIKLLLILSSHSFFTVPSGQPSSSPTGFTSIIPHTWSTVREPSVSGSADANAILSAAWSSASTVIAVGFVQESNKGLILRSLTGGSTWSALSVNMTDLSALFVNWYSPWIDIHIHFLTSAFDEVCLIVTKG